MENRLKDRANIENRISNIEYRNNIYDSSIFDVRDSTSGFTPAGIYIHIPFCARKCPYCDFYSVTDNSLISRFIDSLVLEMKMRREVRLLFDTIYIGGGTPSLLKPAEIEKIIDNTFALFKITSDPEITVEINPGTITSESMKDFRLSGINRINIGVQSFNDLNLEFLGRIHSAEDGKRAIRLARNAGFENFGIDLIYGIPEQTESSWLSDLKTGVGFDPEHISCYMLSYEQGTPLYNDLIKGRFSPIPESLAASLFISTGVFLKKRGYNRYEISNFARSEETQSLHNKKYWTYAPYIGFGPSAHSFDGTRRSWNVKSVSDYIKIAEAGNSPVEGEEELTEEQQMIEAIFLGLRQKYGIDTGLFNEKFNVCFEEIFSDTISGLVKRGLAVLNKNSFALTEKGMVLLDSICAEFVCRGSVNSEQ